MLISAADVCRRWHDNEEEVVKQKIHTCICIWTKIRSTTKFTHSSFSKKNHAQLEGIEKVFSWQKLTVTGQTEISHMKRKGKTQAEI